MALAIGIDLGTTNSVVAYSRDRQARVLPALSGELLTPSVVSYQRVVVGDDRLLVGRPAVNNAIRAPQESVFSIKRLMGRTFDEPQVAQVTSHFGYPVLKSADRDDPGVFVKLGEEQFSPVDVSAIILRYLKEAAETALGESVTRAVVTVPAYFEERQRAATRAAAEQAGLIVKKIIDEPTAAAVAFGVSQPGSRKRILVYDLGGGTFDVSIIQWVGDRYEVVAIDGDNWLGGDDFDRQIVERLTTTIREAYGFDPSIDARYLKLARRHAEEAKIALSQMEEYELVVPGITRSSDGRLIDIDVVITRDDFDRMISPYVDRTIDILKKVVGAQNLHPSDFDEVLLVGGSTAIPLVHASVVEIFGRERVKRHVDPMYCVALGASVLAEDMRGTECQICGEINLEESSECQSCHERLLGVKPSGRITLNEVTARALGIGCKDDVYAEIIPKGTLYPLRQPMTRVFHPTVNLQTGIFFPVYEGEAQPASANSLQGAVNFQVDRPMPLDTPIWVTFDYDRDRVLAITVRPQDQSPHHTRLDRSRPPEVFEVSLTAADADWMRRLARAIETATGFFEQYGDLMTPQEATRIRKDIERANLALSRSDKRSGLDSCELLERRMARSGVASMVYIAQAMAARCAPEVANELYALIAELRTTFSSDASRSRQAAEDLDGLLTRIVEEMEEGKEP